MVRFAKRILHVIHILAVRFQFQLQRQVRLLSHFGHILLHCLHIFAENAELVGHVFQQLL